MRIAGRSNSRCRRAQISEAPGERADERIPTIGEIVLGDHGRALVRAGRYRHGGDIAVTLIDAARFEPIATLSTNLVASGARLDRDAFTVKVCSENEPLISSHLSNGLFQDTGPRIARGFVQARGSGGSRLQEARKRPGCRQRGTGRVHAPDRSARAPPSWPQRSHLQSMTKA
jgi:hypothetical protein